MRITFTKLTDPLPEIAETLNKWANDPAIIPFIRPNRSEGELAIRTNMTVESLSQKVKQTPTYLIHVDGRLVGEINFQVDPGHLMRKEAGTAWIGIVIGEASARGKGVGTRAMEYLEQQIQAHGLVRIELGVFEFNANAIKLYKNMGYEEIGRVDAFTYWRGKMWQDIRMEKYLLSRSVRAAQSVQTSGRKNRGSS